MHLVSNMHAGCSKHVATAVHSALPMQHWRLQTAAASSYRPPGPSGCGSNEQRAAVVVTSRSTV